MKTKAWTPSTDDIIGFWGKTSVAGPYPLVYHLLHTAAMVEAYCNAHRNSVRCRLFAAPFGDDIDRATAVLRLLGGLHDIGKVSPSFQGKVPDAVSKRLAGHFSTSVTRMLQSHHSLISEWFLRRFLSDQLGLPPVQSAQLARIAGGHHGWYWPIDKVTRYLSNYEPGPWQRAREEIARSILDALADKTHRQLLPGYGKFTSEWVMEAGGLLTLCDWLASSEQFFPSDATRYAGNTLKEIYRQSISESARAIASIGLEPPQFDRCVNSFSRLFPFAKNPYALQKAAISLAGSARDPGLLIAEVPTGTGKTEAALAVAAEWMSTGESDGVYFALPTQATSNQMFDRFRSFLEGFVGDAASVDLHLLHSRSELSDSYRTLNTFQGQAESSAVQAHGWFRASKRGLLAPFAVGTIDQALYATLNVRHFNLRLFGLSGKTVVLDEVHAYDTYTSTLLIRLVEWLRLFGARVIILSATLTPSARRHLLDAWAPGGSSHSLQYPHLTLLSQTVECKSIPVESPSKEYFLEPIDEDDWVPSIAASVVSGGCTAVICNTVGAAQDLYEQLASSIGNGDVELHLLHARFPLHRRLELEGAVLRRFGKNGSHRPDKAILISTQIIEQSLDLDFDVMFSELAPVDLMLQRAGRLHRHADRVRPDSHQVPRLFWLQSLNNQGLPEHGVSSRVYASFILTKTWESLRKRERLQTPMDVPTLIEEVYESEVDDSEQLLQPRLRSEFASLDLERKRQEVEARRWVLNAPSSSVVTDYLGGTGRDDETGSESNALHVLTRLSRPSVELVCLLENADGTRLSNGKPLPSSPSSKPDPEQRRDVLLSTVSIGRHEWVEHFRSSEDQTLASLGRRFTHLHPVRFGQIDETQRFVHAVDGVGSIIYDPRLGLTFSKGTEEGQ